MKTKLLTMILPVLLLMGSWAGAQTVIITDDPDYESGEASAVLDVKSEAGGFLLPRMTQAQRDAIDLPATGLLVFQLDGLSGLYYNAGSPEEPAWHILEATHLVIEPPAAGYLWDVDGNQYPWVRIGDHQWMTSNLRVTHHRNGTPIPDVLQSADWASAAGAARSHYDNLASHAGEFGVLYNWHAVNDPSGLCPDGWTIPSEQDWQALSDAAGGAAVAGVALKAARHWDSPIASASNVLGFAALPAGQREAHTGYFNALRSMAGWWSVTQAGAGQAVAAKLQASSDSFSLEAYDMPEGLSVRCVKNINK
jgi:uncharacterized protein (TIGR02145 family)